MATIVENLDLVMADVRRELRTSNEGEAGYDPKRDFDVALMHLEDARMRVNRAMALKRGVFTEGDVEQFTRDSDQLRLPNAVANWGETNSMPPRSGPQDGPGR